MNNQIRSVTAADQPMAHDQLTALLNERANLMASRSQRLVVRSGARLVFVDPGQVDWVQAEGNYVRLHVGEESHLIRHTMHAVEARLGAQFVRIHRSRIANIQNVRELRVARNGEYDLVLRSGRALRVSRLYRHKVQDRLRRSP
jgi:two-component system, LytTR family, response regulator